MERQVERRKVEGPVNDAGGEGHKQPQINGSIRFNHHASRVEALKTRMSAVATAEYSLYLLGAQELNVSNNHFRACGNGHILAQLALEQRLSLFRAHRLRETINKSKKTPFAVPKPTRDEGSS